MLCRALAQKVLEDSDEDLLLELGGWCVRRLVDAQGLGEGKGGEDQATDGPTKETAAGLDLAGLQLATYAITIVRWRIVQGCVGLEASPGQSNGVKSNCDHSPSGAQCPAPRRLQTVVVGFASPLSHMSHQRAPRCQTARHPNPLHTTAPRYLVDHGRQSAPSLLTHLMDTLDLLHLACRLLLAPPWRDAPSGRAFQDGAWRPVPPPNRRALLPQEVQAWLTVHGAVRDEGVRARLDATPTRRAALCALGPPLGNGVLTQMPVLRPLHAFLAALDTWGGAPGTGRAAAARAAPRIAPLSRASVAATLRGAEWGAARRAARAHVLCPAAGEALRQRLPTLAAALEAACEAQEATGVQVGVVT